MTPLQAYSAGIRKWVVKHCFSESWIHNYDEKIKDYPLASTFHNAAVFSYYDAKRFVQDFGNGELVVQEVKAVIESVG